MKVIQQLTRIFILYLLTGCLLSCTEDGPEGEINEDPLIEDQSFSVMGNSANGTVVGTIEATDTDGDELTFSIMEGNTGDAFAIGPSSGEITVSNATALEGDFVLTVEVSDGRVSVSASITIAIIEGFASKEEILEALDNSYAQLKEYIEYTYLFDAVYSNTVAAPGVGWNEIHAHTATSTDSKFYQLWTDAWEVVYMVNNIISSSENVLEDGEEKTGIIGQAKTIRAYLFLNLLNSFGDIPIDLESAESSIARSPVAEVVAFIKNDLAEVIASGLPNSWPAGFEGRFTNDAAQALLLNAYVYNAEWAEALDRASQLLSSGSYALSAEATGFSEGNSEIIWGFGQSGNAEFSAFFTKGDYVPLVRLTEIYLILAESSLHTGDTEQATDRINVLKVRRGEPELASGLSQGELMEEILAQWKTELTLEGRTFSTLKRFGKAEEELSLPFFKVILPLPQTVLDANPNLMQNPGY